MGLDIPPILPGLPNFDDGALGPVKFHFRSLLIPRNHGLIAVADCQCGSTPTGEARYGLVAALGRAPFMVFSVYDEKTSILIAATYPDNITHYDPMKGEYSPLAYSIQPFSKRPKDRYKQVKAALSGDMLNPHGKPASNGRSVFNIPKNQMWIDLCDPDAIYKAEYVVNNVITRVRYMVTNSRFAGLKIKDNCDLRPPLELALISYAKNRR